MGEGGDADRHGAEIHIFDWETKFNCNILQVSVSFTEVGRRGCALSARCGQRHTVPVLLLPATRRLRWEAPGPRAGLCWPPLSSRDKSLQVLLGLTAGWASREVNQPGFKHWSPRKQLISRGKKPGLSLPFPSFVLSH